MAEGKTSNLFCNNFYDPVFEKKLNTFRKVQKFRRTHPLAKKADAVNALGLSKNTVSKYWESENEPEPKKQNSSSEKIRSAISKVADNDRDILNIILHVYLEGDKNFDCDLTYGNGDFYKELPFPPNHCYDKYPVKNQDEDAPKVYMLDDIDNPKSEGYIPDNSLSSIVIDLPQKISKSGKGNVGAFKSMTDLANTYNEMLKLAENKLRYATPDNPGGLLIIKVGDIIHKGETIWLSQIVSEIIVGPYTSLGDKFRSKVKKWHYVSFDLVDKFVHRYKPDDIDDSEEIKRSIKAHDYYLVFRKGINPQSQVFYYVSEYGNVKRALEGTIMNYESYGPYLEDNKNKVRSILRKNPSANIYEVVIYDRSKQNTLYLSQPASSFKESVNRKLEKLRERYPDLPSVCPRLAFATGYALLKFIKNEIVEKYTPAGYEGKVNLRHRETANFLKDCGIKYIYFDTKEKIVSEPVWIVINADTLQITKVMR